MAKQMTCRLRISPQPERSTEEVLAGLVERVTFHNAENGFCVLRARARGHRDVVTVVGHAATISPGEWITASGDWVNDRTHGQQFKARFLRTSPPSSADGIEKYLASGMIRGVGPVYAKKLVRAFGEKVFDVIEATPDRLREIDGIGPVRATSILAAWAEQKAVREIMVFLHSHGVSTARAVRIFKTYGSDAIQVMTENPYELARDIRGIGFKTADAIAMKLGIEKTAVIRVRAGISFVEGDELGVFRSGVRGAEGVRHAGTIVGPAMASVAVSVMSAPAPAQISHRRLLCAVATASFSILDCVSRSLANRIQRPMLAACRTAKMKV